MFNWWYATEFIYIININKWEYPQNTEVKYDICICLFSSKKSGWSQEELAEQIGVSRQTISKWEGA